MGKVRFVVFLKSGTIESRNVNYATGWDYCGDYLILQENEDGVTTHYPYCLRDVEYFTRESIETVH